MPKRYLLATEIDRVKKKHPPFELQLPEIDEIPPSGDDIADGQPGYAADIILIPATQNMPDDVVTWANTQPVRAARALLGDKWDHFTRAGGTANMLWDIVQEHAKATMGESGASDAS